MFSSRKPVFQNAHLMLSSVSDMFVPNQKQLVRGDLNIYFPAWSARSEQPRPQLQSIGTRSLHKSSQGTDDHAEHAGK